MNISALVRGKAVYGLEGDALQGYMWGAGCQYSSVAVYDFDGDREEFARGMRLAGVSEVIFREP